MPKKIIVADDKADFSLSLQLLLEGAGFAVRAATTAHAALQMQQGDPADILITDLVMPDMDGIELIVRFRNEFPATRLVLLSGNEMLNVPIYLSAAKLIGVDVAFQKPVDPGALVNALQAL